MQTKKLDKIEGELCALRASPRGIKRERLVSLAARLGRVPRHSMGKEPRYEHSVLKGTRPLTIPGHKGTDLKPGTVRNIADQLLEDVELWRDHLRRFGIDEDDDDTI